MWMQQQRGEAVLLSHNGVRLLAKQDLLLETPAINHSKVLLSHNGVWLLAKQDLLLEISRLSAQSSPQSRAGDRCIYV